MDGFKMIKYFSAPGNKLKQHTFWIQQSGNAQMFLCSIEGMLQVYPCFLFVELIHIHQVWPDVVYYCTKSYTIPPALAKICYMHAILPR